VSELGNEGFAWAIGKALLIVIVSFGTLVDLARAVTWRRDSAACVEIALERLPKKRHITH
jgi:hypothetical protein